MKSPALFKEYIWLVNTIYRAGRISLAEINEKWVETEMSEGVEFARATFNRHKDAIQDMFGIFIECDRKDGFRYYIGNDEVLRENTVQNWMLSTLTVNNIISDSMPLNERILLEPIATDDEYLKLALEAMKKNVKLSIEYQKYETDKPKHFNIEPYALKLFSQRWYVLAHIHFKKESDKPDWKTFLIFAFDRIKNMQLTNEKFVMKKGFSANDYFNDAFGIIVDETECCRVVLRAFDTERFYTRDLPLHHSQKEIGEGDGYADFEYNLCPTFDFKNKVLSYAGRVKVLEPQWLADEIREAHRMAVERYE